MPTVDKIRRFIRAVALGSAVVLVSAACTSSSGGGTSTTAPETVTSTSTVATTTTDALLTTLPPHSIPGETSPSIPAEIADAMRDEIGSLILDVEESRALPFITVPTVTILDEADFTERVRSTVEEDLDVEEIADSQKFFELLGMLDGDLDLYQLMVDLMTEQVAGFYDPDVDELVVPVSADGISALQKMTIVHELVHALTDQHFDFNDVYEQRIDSGNGDDVNGVLALVEGDATYQQFLFLEAMPPMEAARAVLEASTYESAVYDSAPAWIRSDLGFPYEMGSTFSAYLIQQDGLHGIDSAYLDLPTTSEQILHPEKYTRREGPSDLPPPDVDLAGWEMIEEGSLGEWGIRLVLLEALLPGELTQAAAGWGNDQYRFFTRGDEAAIAWVYRGETVRDAEDLTNGLISHIKQSMHAGSPAESGGGLLYSGGSNYVFIDRVDGRIYMVASTDASAGASLRTQLGL